MDRFENLRTFVKVADFGSISAAAEHLGIAKSAVSRRISDLGSNDGGCNCFAAPRGS
ncbi:helix-turn-helix domain-containing protein [Kaarinaea lacus]